MKRIMVNRIEHELRDRLHEPGWLGLLRWSVQPGTIYHEASQRGVLADLDQPHPGPNPLAKMDPPRLLNPLVDLDPFHGLDPL